MGFRLMPTLVTLNDFEWVIALILPFSPNSMGLQVNYATVVED